MPISAIYRRDLGAGGIGQVLPPVQPLRLRFQSGDPLTIVSGLSASSSQTG
jgi:hypothetical protein